MNQAAIDTTPKARPASAFAATRSPVLSQFRTNPFRVLRTSPDIGVDQAIWKAEEVLTRIRAGLPSTDPDLLPWLPEPDEPETRQAVQRIEEPLSRLVDEMFWFDIEHDPDGALLVRALAALDPGLLNDYLARCTDDGLVHRPTVSIAADGAINDETDQGAAINGDMTAETGTTPRAVAHVATASVARLINQANVRLLLAPFALHGTLPDGLYLASDQKETNDRAQGPLDWKWADGLETADNAHERRASGANHAGRSRRTVVLWSDALARWHRLTNSSEFIAFVHERIAQLDDEVFGEDDVEVIVNSASSRLTDLLVAEVKAQFLMGEMEGVRALLEVAEASEVPPRSWAVAFRPLRLLFRTEAVELEPLLPAAEDPRFADAALYLSRLETLKTRWAGLDPAGRLGLAEVGDEAVAKVCDCLAGLESYAVADRVKPLYAEAMGLAAADSLKQRIATAVTRLNGFEHYACHFCRSREMDLDRSIMATGKRESHRNYGYNSTTIHYMLKANIIPRCLRCSDLHEYLWNVTFTTRRALGVATACVIGFLIWLQPFGQDLDAIAYIVVAAAAVAVILLAGMLARWTLTLLATPRGERRYWKASSAKQYQDMKSEGCDIKLDYRRNAFPLYKKEQEREPV